MYAIIEISGRQYRVSPQDTIEVNRTRSAAPERVSVEKVLLVVDGEKVSIGQPHVSGARVEAEVIGAVKGPKQQIYKFLRRKDMRRKTGHRQPLSLLKITNIVG